MKAVNDALKRSEAKRKCGNYLLDENVTRRLTHMIFFKMTCCGLRDGGRWHDFFHCFFQAKGTANL